MNRIPSAAAALFACSSLSTAQVIGPERLIAPAGGGLSHIEPVIAVSPLDNREVTVAWQAYRPLTNLAIVHYAVTLDGHTFTAPAEVPRPGGCTAAEGSFDPVIAVSSSSGQTFVGGVEQGVGSANRPFVAAKASGATTIGASDSYAVWSRCDRIVDKPWLAVGPLADSAIETMYASFLPGIGGFLTMSRCDPGAPLGTAWPPEPSQINAPGGLFGPATATVVVPGGTRRGRLVLSKSNKTQRPQWTRTDNGGALWLNALEFATYGVGQPMDDLVPAPNTRIVPPGMRALSFTSMAIDPNDPNVIYILFAARDSTSTSNVDLFLAVSIDGGESFPAPQVIRLTDAQLRLSGEPEAEADQLLPCIAIDGSGGINLAFVHTTTPDDPAPGVETRATIRYARFADRTLLGGTPFLADLTAPFRVSEVGLSVGHRFNDYMMICASGCRVYVAYVRAADFYDPNPATDLGTVCVRAITTEDGCEADSDGDGAITANDPPAFTNAYLAASHRADANLDGAVTSADAIAFLNAYAAASGPP